MTPLRFERPPRTAWSIVVLAGLWLAIVALWWLTEASNWIAAALLLATVPAALDFAMGRRAGFGLDDDRLTWHSGRQSGEVALTRIAAVRFERRFDLTVRVRVQIDSGRRIRIPQDALPPQEVLDKALTARGIRTERHPFALL